MHFVGVWHLHLNFIDISIFPTSTASTPPKKNAKGPPSASTNNETYTEIYPATFKTYYKLRKRDEEVEKGVLEKASGVFMWVALVVSLLNKAIRILPGCLLVGS